MRTYINTTQDTSIYQRYADINTGLDGILEVGKSAYSTDVSNTYASASVRSLLNFNIVSGSYISSSEYYLNLYVADAKYVNRYQTIEVCPVSRSWVEGSGYFHQDVRNVSDGASWQFATRTATWTTSGSDYTTNLTASYEFSDVPIVSNVRINVTSLIAPVVAGTNTTQWNGLLVKFPNADENDQNNVGNIKFYSGNTHTIYQPKLEVVWYSQTFTTGSLKPIVSSNISILPKNMKESYTQGEVDKVYLVIRDPYPDKRFDAVQRYRNTYYLPSESYFRIRDHVSDTQIQRFDAYSAINCDSSGSYIVLDTSGLDTNRYYTLDLKVKSGELVFYPEFNYKFRIDADD